MTSSAQLSRSLGIGTVKDEVAKILRHRIQAGELRPGSRLLQDHLAREFGVSQVPIREALGQLTYEGLVSIEPRRGAVVRVLTQAEFVEILHLRVLLETDLMKQAASHVNDAGLEALRSAVEEMSDPKRSLEWAFLNWKFHSTIYRYANAPQTLGVLERLYMAIARHSMYERFNANAMRASNAEHAQLIDLIKKKQTARAVSLLKAHIKPHIGTVIGSLSDRSDQN